MKIILTLLATAAYALRGKTELQTELQAVDYYEEDDHESYYPHEEVDGLMYDENHDRVYYDHYSSPHHHYDEPRPRQQKYRRPDFNIPV